MTGKFNQIKCYNKSIKAYHKNKLQIINKPKDTIKNSASV